MMNQMPDKINVLTAILHVKEAARLLETSNLDVSQALYKVALALIEKEYAKIINENNGIFENKLIPKVLNTVYYCLITEEFWDILKKYKNPKINFKTLQNKVFDKVRPII